MSVTTGNVDYVVGSETFQTWYKVVGDLKCGARPLVALHGGPGIAHHYMLPHAELWASHGIPVVLYDQIGIGESSHLRGKPKEFFTVELFVEELENLLQKLDIIDNFDVVGHSWGGILATSWVCSRHPLGLKRMVLVGTPAAMHLWEMGARSLVDELPEDVRETVKKSEREGNTDSDEYKNVMGVFYVNFVCKVQPRPEDLRKAKEAQVADMTVHTAMCGTTSFYDLMGNLKTWSPTLILNGVDDEAGDICVSPLFWKIPKAKWVKFAHSSHMPFFEEKEKYLEVVAQFLTQ
ncbi:predicted protein [Postia placenta Mad-698-R]|nr:predicted protein [Postia placenta Mad-698-R]